MSDRNLDRRSFIGVTAAAGAALGVARPARALASQAFMLPAADIDLNEVTIAGLQAGMAKGQYTARALAEAYLARIDAVNTRGPMLRAVIETNPDALAIADTLDAERKAKGARGPLHGIPVLLKDNIGTKDRQQSTAGSLAIVGSAVPRDAFLADKLRAAGAVILGKSNLSEWANFRSSHSTSGWSGRGGQCRNPYVLDRTPSGSSSGSAVAVAANLCAVAVGSETDGSIVSPSSCNSIVGIKPTLGLISRAGVIPIAHSQDTAGPMGRTVADAATLLGAMVGVDARDPATADSAGKLKTDYTAFLDPQGLKGMRLGIARAHYFGQSPKTDALMETAIQVLKDHGAVIVDPADIATLGKFDDSEFDVLLYEFKADINTYLAQLAPGGPKSLEELIAWNTAHQDQELKYFGQEVFVQAQAKGPLTEKAYLDALAKDHQMARTDGIDATMQKYQLDAIVAPTNGPPSPLDFVNGEGGSVSSSTVAAVAGYPSVTVPAGYTFGLPVGISFFGKPWSEGTLIKAAYAYEQASKLRVKPGFAPTVAY
ncbi:MAG TPA: amidase [Gemmatimonadales bacterium]|nr:amidase [Gemmatimonadales bacterium]